MSVIVVAVVVVVVLEVKWRGAPFDNLTQNSEQQFSVLWFDAEIFLSQEEAFEPQQPPQQKTTKNKQSKTASRPTRTLFQASTSSEAAPSTSDLLPSPSQIDPEFLAALPDDVREELEQAYKLKNSNITGNRAQAEASSAPVLPVVRGLGNDKGALQSGAIQKEETEKGNRPPSKQKQVNLICYDKDDWALARRQIRSNPVNTSPRGP